MSIAKQIFPRGSQWRKWDLHVHTPFSHLNNQFGDDWDHYVKTLFNKALEKGVSGIGITDYFSIEGYKKLKNEYLNNDHKLLYLFLNNSETIKKIKDILVVPNVELRLNKFVGNKSIELHVLFSDEVTAEDIEEHFIHELKFVYESNAQTGDNQMSLKKENLVLFGKKTKLNQIEFKNDSDLVAGLKSVSIDDGLISKVLEDNKVRFGGKYLIGLPVNDLSGIDWGSRDGQVRKSLTRKSDFLFTANPGSIEWGLAKKGETEEDFKKEFKSLKPCVWGCDAHLFEKLFEPENKRYTWIKADLSFEGLKQIKYEPADRVFIGEVAPDQKAGYLRIDKVRFIHSTTQSHFSPDWIEINQNLSCIIGGKSSGKSLLLYYIAKAVSPEEARKLQDAKNSTPYDYDDDSTFDFEVLWSDGVSNKLSEDEKEKKRRITYLPQMAVNRLVEEQQSKQFRALIEDILLQNDEYKTYNDEFLIKKEEVSRSLEANIVALFLGLNRQKDIRDALKKLGDKEAVIKQLQVIKTRINDLTKDSSLSSEELLKLSQYRISKEDKQKLLVSFQETARLLSQFLEFIEKDLGNNVALLIEQKLSSLKSQSRNVDGFEKVIYPVGQEMKQGIKLYLQSNLSRHSSTLGELNGSIEKIAAELDALDKENAPVAAKIKNQELLLKEQDAQKVQEKILGDFSEYERKSLETLKSIEDFKEKIWHDRAQFRTVHQELLDKIKTLGVDSISDDIKLIAKPGFEHKAFNESIQQTLNLRNLKAVFHEKYDEERQTLSGLQLDDFKRLFSAVLSDEIKLKGGNQLIDAVRRILQNYIKIDFNLLHKNDEFEKMSPGKRGLVILKLILHLSNSKEPILIDQPEDNLDNRTIYDELNIFIKERKSRRQIIMVTHNANLVVSTDAEQVVVANQDGQEVGKDNAKFRFEYIGGSLENSFEDLSQKGTLQRKGIKQHVCEVLEGGKQAFLNRQQKYSFET